MKQITLIIIAVIWIIILIILIISLTNLYPNNTFEEHRVIVVIAFISITTFLKFIYNSVIDKNKNVN